MNKLKNVLWMPAVASFLFALSATPVHAAGFNEGEAKSFIESFITPMTNVALWAVPLVAILACIFTGIVWMLKDEEEKESKHWKKPIKGIIFAAVIAESIAVILKIFGIAA